MATSTVPVKHTGKTGSTIFLKTVMAVTGVIFVLFVLLHMYGNLKLFVGESAYNEYSEHLRTIGEPVLPYHGLLYIIEAVLLVSVIAHVYCAATLWKRANAARPQRYSVKKRVAASISSKWMRWGGLFLLLFIIWHLLQFTILKLNVGSGGQGAAITQNPYQLVVSSFNVWWLTLIYLAAMIALGMHLNHGIWSASQTLGFTPTPTARRIAKTTAGVVALVVAVGFILPPLFILFGVID
ncbi:succinate dehydrogenase cytochrome b subunit [Branchiibius sp. NY16-3462-2]|uniref:succinate dehydrogenase cytochrome b subunit n=1 Tax=Branchiibius sp. NY16-3462-2 TaxID=1807500 RepID=UPI0007980C4B|nr:succinate dehydrogenase cytochrome b subunit [Branchiibius sp. NY16-3462-2]KYH43049.1 succinate dehydrogenase [Branchiibius sp. NY16-3462-2]